MTQSLSLCIQTSVTSLQEYLMSYVCLILSTVNTLNVMFYKMNNIIITSTLFCTHCLTSLRSHKMQ